MDTERNKQPNLSKVEKNRLLYFIKDEIETKYKEFKRADGENTTLLYVGDFRPLQNAGSNNGNLELLLPSEMFITVDYSEVFISILRTFDLDRASNDFESGTGGCFTELSTNNLNRFKKEHPDVKLKTEYMFFELESGSNEQRMISRTRFIDPVTKELLTEAWEATKYSFY